MPSMLPTSSHYNTPTPLLHAIGLMYRQLEKASSESRRIRVILKSD